MLTKLHIRNYAIIEEIEISFTKGLTIITGETGAGKSILLGALSLILGERADTKALGNQNEKCVIEGLFSIQHIQSVKQLLIDNEFESDDELIIRREINTSGKSRVFINDTPSTLQMLQKISTLLIDLHRQFDTQELQQSSEQLQLIDEICKNGNLLSKYQLSYKTWKSLQQRYHEEVEKNKQIKLELDYNEFLFTELSSFNIQANELEEIELELDVLNHSEVLKSSLQSAIHLLKENEDPILAQLKSMLQQLDTFRSKIPKLESIHQRINSSLIELKEICVDLEDLNDETFYDEERINLLTERLNEGNRLLKKHHLQHSDDLVALKDQVEEKIRIASFADSKEKEMKDAIDIEFNELTKLANELSNSRKKEIVSIEKKVNALLKKVGMPNAVISISMQQGDFSSFGIDKIDMLFDANKTGKFVSISKVASGGELSRLMLCIKSLLADSTSLPTLLFDEIDTGISGETALQVGNIMKELSKEHQLICITHLPQIAGKADQHLFIFKEENADGKIMTQLKVLNHEERINVLAEMLSGKNSSSQAKEMVKQLMQ